MMPELLSPVGSEESLYAAVRSGADAVYLGYDRFNARQSAKNFDDESFLKAVEYCRVRGVRVYLTLNTLLSDGELDAALQTAKKACDAGVDGFIVQDLGLVRRLRSSCPDMPLHASTQMTVTSPSALYELKKLGFTRVVLAREMSEREIAELCDEAHRLSMETEVFVHGALCMSVSGQCYMSSVIGRRSGNRGLCAQPCRLPARGGGYPLSLKDLSLVSFVEKLKEIGVDSFKIEGRMKRPEYIAASTAAFRQMLDNGWADPDLLDRLDRVFSRSGHTDGYFVGKRGTEMFGHRTEIDVAASGLALGGLRELYRNERPRIAVDIAFFARQGENMKMTMTDGENYVTVENDPPQIAVNRAADEEYVKAQCEKLGGTPYYCRAFTAELDGRSAIPASQLNRMRRECVDLLNGKRRPKSVAFYDNMPDVYSKIGCSDVEITPDRAEFGQTIELYARFSHIDRIPDNLDGVRGIFVPVDTPKDQLKGLVERSGKVEVGVELPRALFSLESACKGCLAAAKEVGAKWALCHNIAALPIVKDSGLDIFGGYGLGIFNSQAEKAVYEMGAKKVTLSFESTPSRFEDLCCDRAGIVGYGRLPLMLTRNCPAEGIKGKCAECDGDRSIVDRAGERFPIECRYGMSEVLNSKVLWLADRKDRFSDIGFMMLNFTDESKDRAAEVISAYRSFGTASLTGPDVEFTRGLYERGVI